MGVATAIAVGGAIVGGIAGAQGQHSSSSATSSVNLTPPSANETAATTGIGQDYSALQGMVGAGPGQKDVTNAYNQQQSLATMLGDYAKTGGAAGQQDILQAQSSAALQFAPQQVALDQTFKQEQLRANQLAAQLGRPVNDPYIQAQLGINRMNSQQMLAANQGAYVDQQSRQNAMQRLGFTSQLTDVQNSLASQAMSNRQALLSIGQGIQTNERNFRLQTAGRTVNQEGQSGGGLAGGISGALAGAGMGAGISKNLGFSATTQGTVTPEQQASDDVGRLSSMGADISQYSGTSQPMGTSTSGYRESSVTGGSSGYNPFPQFGGPSNPLAFGIGVNQVSPGQQIPMSYMSPFYNPTARTDAAFNSLMGK